jgi:hypothetical protein
MMKTLLIDLMRIVGLLVAVSAVYLVWRGVDAQDSARGEENEITKLTSENAYRHRTGEAAEEKLAGPRQRMQEKQTESYLWFGGAAGAVAVGLAMALLPSVRRSPRKRKDAVAEPAPSPSPEPSGGPEERFTAAPGGTDPGPAPDREAPGL